MTEKLFLKVWVFTRGDKRIELSFIVETTEQQAREALKRKGIDPEGWDAATKAIAVEVGPAVDPDAEEREFTVTLTRTQRVDIQVTASSEEEAIQMALKKTNKINSWDIENEDWDVDMVSEE